MKQTTALKSFLVASAIALSIPLAAQADDHKAHREGCSMHEGKHGKSKMGYMADKLELTEAQRAEFQTLMKAHKENMMAERNNFMTKVDAVLTPEQRLKAKEMRERHEERHRKYEDR